MSATSFSLFSILSSCNAVQRFLSKMVALGNIDIFNDISIHFGLVFHPHKATSKWLSLKVVESEFV